MTPNEPPHVVEQFGWLECHGFIETTQRGMA